MTNKYAEDGVDVAAGDDFSAFAGTICQQSYNNSPFVEVTDLSHGNFRGPRGWHLKGLPAECMLTSVMDGIGTKVVLIDAAGTYEDAAHDIIAMTAMDITRYGGLPLVFTSILDVSTLGEEDSETRVAARTLMRGLAKVAAQHEYVLLTGETAELGACVASENPEARLAFNWGSAMTGVYHPDKMVLGDTLAPGQVVIVLQDTFRSNGISSVRKALALRYGATWWNNPEARKHILQAATPSTQYDRFINNLHGWFTPDLQPMVKLHLVSHLSGGAFRGKFGDLLKAQELSAELYDLFDPPSIMQECAEWRGMSSEECYETWNGGQGALLVVDRAEADLVIQAAEAAGVNAQIAGDITHQQDFTVAIRSKFNGQWIQY